MVFIPLLIFGALMAESFLPDWAINEKAETYEPPHCSTKLNELCPECKSASDAAVINEGGKCYATDGEGYCDRDTRNGKLVWSCRFKKCQRQSDCSNQEYCNLNGSCRLLKEWIGRYDAINGVCSGCANPCVTAYDSVDQGIREGQTFQVEHCYRPLGKNRVLTGRPKGEGPTSYDFQTAMTKCAAKKDCGGLTCNVHDQGTNKCELRKSTASSGSYGGDCRQCMSYRKYEDAESAVGGMTGGGDAMAMSLTPASETPMMVNVFAALGFSALVYGAFRHYTQK